MKNKNFWILLILMLAGIILGGFIGSLAAGTEGFSWLNYGQGFGLDEPIILNLGILVLTFGLSIHITLASVIGLAAAFIIYRFL